MQRFVDQLVFVDNAICLGIRGLNQFEWCAHGATSEGNNQGYTPEGSGIPRVGVELQAFAGDVGFTAECIGGVDRVEVNHNRRKAMEKRLLCPSRFRDRSRH